MYWSFGRAVESFTIRAAANLLIPDGLKRACVSRGYGSGAAATMRNRNGISSSSPVLVQ